MMNDERKYELSENEMDIRKEIKEDARTAEIPESLRPEEVVRRLKEKQKSRIKPMRGRWIAMAGSAAAVVALTIGAVHVSRNVSGGSGQPDIAHVGQTEILSVSESSGAEKEDSMRPAKKNDTIGENIVLAKSEKDIYRAYRKIERQWEKERIYYSSKLADVEEGEEAGGDAEDSTGTASAKAREYSDTNTMEADVDESDYVKTDGNYIYIAKDRQVLITDIREKKSKVIAKIKPKLGKNEGIGELYVEGDRLLIITSERDQADTCGVEDVIALGKGSVRLLIYDLSDRAKPENIREIAQDGEYMTSRKSGDYLYLFSRIYLWGEKDKEEVIPSVDGKQIPADCVYLEKKATRTQTLISAVDLSGNGVVTDKMDIWYDANDMYMNRDAIYLYQQLDKEKKDKTGKVTGCSTETEIVKLSCREGRLNGESRTKVPGCIQDKFAIHGSKKGLEVLTTDYTYEYEDSADERVQVLTDDNERIENYLTVFDGNMKKTAQIGKIAEGESIQSARYLSDKVYFVTYRNVDPLFAVDLSDRNNPRIQGYLKITGYSDYLHAFGDDLVAGIGYETKKDKIKGVKVTMFDTAHPEKMKALKSICFPFRDQTAAEYDYKSVFADPKRGLLGIFSGDDYDSQDYYNLLRWNGNSFDELIECKLPQDVMQSSGRSFYAGDRLYMIFSGYSQLEDCAYYLYSFDMNDQYKPIEKINL